MTETADLIVIGGGLAGLVAAARASELGLRPIVLEQGADADYRCNSRASGGILHIAYHDAKEDPNTLEKAIRKATSGEVDETLARSVAANAGRAVDWLAANGTRFVRASPINWHRWTVAPPRPMGAGLDFPGRGVDTILTRLSRDMEARGGTILLGHKVVGLRRLADGVLRVECVAGDGSPRFQARAVVIADGGFQANAEMLREYVSPRPDLLVQRGAATGRGDCIRFAVALGASVTPMSRFYGHLLHRDALTNDRLWPYPMLDSIAVASMLVGRDGKRIADEARGGIYLANVVAGLDEPASAAIVFSERVWTEIATQGLFPANPNLDQFGGQVVKAGSIAELADALDIDGEGLAATVGAFNQALGGNVDAGLDVPPTGKRFALEPPYMAVPVCAGITHTMGGLAIDGHARVVNADGVPLPGLYAAGSSTGGLEGGGSAGYVGGLMKAVITGLLAAEDLAAASGRPAVAAASTGTAPADTSWIGRIEEYRFLRAVIRYGHLVCLLCALGAALAGAAVASPAAAWFLLACSIGGGILGYVLARLLVELLTLIVRMLLPAE
jgi:fumarate reductase flavoprotein subunit